ncbi:MAG: hypothetical protein ACYCSN_19610 [Acidobacteriaceae bacterium]
MSVDNGQLDLFADLPEEDRAELGLNVPAPVDKKKAEKPKTVAPAVEKEPDEYPVDRTVYYAGHRLPVPSRTMKKEDVRVWLEDQFPELRKDNTEMIYDDKTGALIPVVKAHKKGAKTLEVYLEEPDVVPPRYYHLGKDGRVYEVRTTQAGAFRLPMIDVLQYGANGYYTPSRALPPVDLLDEIVVRFRAEPDTEHVAYLVWLRDHYEVLWPPQIADAVSVTAAGLVETETRYVWMQIHSHGRLLAFWSPQDNRDEVKTGLYGVVGSVHLTVPQATFRMSVAGRFSYIDGCQLFHGRAESVVDVL